MSDTNTEVVAPVQKKNTFLDLAGLQLYHSELSGIAKTGNVNELNQTDGDILVLKGGNAATYASSLSVEA